MSLATTNTTDVAVTATIPSATFHLPLRSVKFVEEWNSAHVTELLEEVCCVDVTAAFSDVVDMLIADLWHEWKSQVLYLEAAWAKLLRETEFKRGCLCEDEVDALWGSAVGVPRNFVLQPRFVSTWICNYLNACMVGGADLKLDVFERACTHDMILDRWFMRAVFHGLRIRSSYQTIGAEDVADIVMDIMKPISRNGFLYSEDDQAYVVRGLTDCVDNLKAEMKTLCKLTVSGYEYSRDLEAYPQQLNVQWLPGNWIESVYAAVMSKLSPVDNVVVYGHVTDEPTIGRMCCNNGDPNADAIRRGLSVHATLRNQNSCGHAMYFFRMTTPANWADVAGGGGTEQQQGEFQSFMYAISRKLSLGGTRLPAVLLFSIVEEETPDDGSVTLLPTPMPTTCNHVPGIVWGNDNNPMDVERMLCRRDYVQLLERTSVGVSDRIEKLNVAALQFGCAQLPHPRPISMYVSDGTNKWKQCTKKRLRTELIVSFRKFLDGDISDWRQARCLVVNAGRVLKVEPRTVNPNSGGRHAPRELLITSNDQLLELVKNAKSVGVHFIETELWVSQPDNLSTRTENPIDIDLPNYFLVSHPFTFMCWLCPHSNCPRYPPITLNVV